MSTTTSLVSNVKIWRLLIRRRSIAFRAHLSCRLSSDSPTVVESLDLAEQDMIYVTDALRCIIDVYY